MLCVVVTEINPRIFTSPGARHRARLVMKLGTTEALLAVSGSRDTGHIRSQDEHGGEQAITPPATKRRPGRKGER